MDGQGNVFARLNDDIADFVNRPENRRLRPGTGYYSTLFRGTLFGFDSAADVADQLKTRRVDVLWLGTNPNVPESLEYILSTPNHGGHYQQFERQCRSGLYASARWTDNGPEPDWNPLQRPTGGWGVYRDIFAACGSSDAVAMANFIPWGSADAKALVDGIGALDRRLVGRLLEFSDSLNITAVEALSPAIVAVPFSLGLNPAIDRVRQVGVSKAAARGFRRHTVPGLAATFNFHTGWCRRGSTNVPVIYLRHPSSLRFAADDRRRIVEYLVDVVGRVTTESPS